MRDIVGGEELLTLHEFEPTEASVVTEGSSDQAFYSWYIEEVEDLRAVVYQVDSIEVPPLLVASLGQQNSNRGRVIAIAMTVDSALQRHQPACVIDSDYDALLGTQVPGALLLSTDYTCAEMYSYNRKTFSKFLRLHTAYRRGDIEGFLEMIAVVLNRLFLIRATNVSLDWRMSDVDRRRSAAVEGGLIRLDEPEYLKKYLIKNGRWSNRAAFMTHLHELARRVVSDRRHLIHGHDLVALLEWYLRREPGRFALGDAALRDALLARIEGPDLRSAPMLAELSKRLRSGPVGRPLEFRSPPG